MSNQIVNCSVSVLDNLLFVYRRIIKRIEVTPPERLKVMYDIMKGIEKKDVGPCGGFSHMYACMCDYHLLPFREEVAWVSD